MKMYIKESYVYTLPSTISHLLPDESTRWVGCNGDGCGYERTLDDSNNDSHLYRMFKVNGEQICEVCLQDWMQNIKEALEEEE